MAYQNDYYSGFKYCLERNTGFFRMFGINSDYNFTFVYEPRNISYLISLYKFALKFYGLKLHNSLESVIRKEIEKCNFIHHLQTSDSVNDMKLNKVPEILKSFGLYWHWWREKYGAKEGGLKSEVTAVNVLGKCLQVLNEECLDTLLMYCYMFYNDFISEGINYPNLKVMIDDMSYIISVRGTLYNKCMFYKSLPEVRIVIQNNSSETVH